MKASMTKLHFDSRTFFKTCKHFTRSRVNQHGDCSEVPVKHLLSVKPKFECDAGQALGRVVRNGQSFEAPLYHSNFVIKCKVLGLPPVDRVTASWRGAGKKEVELVAGEKKGNQRLSVQDDVGWVAGIEGCHGRLSCSNVCGL